MEQGVKGPERNELRRRRILERALELFLERGYAGTSMEAVAEAADVALQTLYNRFGSKAGLLFAAFDLSVAGEHAPSEPASFFGDRVRAEPDPQRMLDLHADWFVEANTRTAPVQRLLRDAAATDAETAAMLERRAQRRLDNYRLAAAEFQKRGALAPGLEIEDAAALIWSLAHPEVYRGLVLQRGWSPERYRAWIRRSLEAGLLPPG